jgi:hypothetical protein
MTPEEFLTKEYLRLESETGVSVPFCEDGCYCGVKWLMPHRLRVKLSKRFSESCRLHDLYYSLPKMDLKLADKTFYKHMKLQARNSLYWKQMARLYYAIVSTFRFIRR